MATIKAKSFKPLKNNVFVRDLESGMHITKSGIIIPDDNMKDHGIHPRWGCVYAAGPQVEDLQPGDWVYVKHGRWTNGIDLEFPTGVIRVWRVDYPEAVLMACNSDPRLQQW